MFLVNQDLVSKDIQISVIENGWLIIGLGFILSKFTSGVSYVGNSYLPATDYEWTTEGFKHS